MPITAGSTVEYPMNVRVVHATRTTNPEEPLQIVFSCIDNETGREEITTAQVPNAYLLFGVLQEQGWFKPGVARGIRAMTRAS
jgi:hypothetical protein